jgi:hypothetical protein
LAGAQTLSSVLIRRFLLLSPATYPNISPPNISPTCPLRQTTTPTSPRPRHGFKSKVACRAGRWRVRMLSLRWARRKRRRVSESLLFALVSPHRVVRGCCTPVAQIPPCGRGTRTRWSSKISRIGIPLLQPVPPKPWCVLDHGPTQQRHRPSIVGASPITATFNPPTVQLDWTFHVQVRYGIQVQRGVEPWPSWYRRIVDRVLVGRNRLCRVHGDFHVV